MGDEKMTEKDGKDSKPAEEEEDAAKEE